ncbi:hypothetical protein AU210_002409 [Fusarium oxysporum f. sp. radicis-cucumerinum]|uniref:Uncharacterized protein n=1 Tax=Fusarium oxysporum f. sp. radicis-cucumerinum TaxID=327505 RepID=A0A2H3HZC1_FUSOX|nr:hypothetical protein AU210_002409 [Fusarium oxysporum f. sp. radicis-cucumerinum]
MAIAMGWQKPDNVAGSSAPAIMVGLFVASGGLLFGYDTGRYTNDVVHEEGDTGTYRRYFIRFDDATTATDSCDMHDEAITTYISKERKAISPEEVQEGSETRAIYETAATCLDEPPTRNSDSILRPWTCPYQPISSRHIIFTARN